MGIEAVVGHHILGAGSRTHTFDAAAGEAGTAAVDGTLASKGRGAGEVKRHNKKEKNKNSGWSTEDL